MASVCSEHRSYILGVGVSAINMEMTLQQLGIWINSRESNYVCLAPAHAIMECHNQPELREIYNHSGLTTPDGMSIVWLLRLAGFRHVERVYGPDLMLAACERFLNTGARHYFYGGAPGVAERLAQQLTDCFPELAVVGIDSPPFRELTAEEDAAVVERIRAAQPDIVWVGIGSPRQEEWMAVHLNQLDVPVLVGVGAAFDFLSGNKLQAPRWIQRSGLEWFFRLMSEPVRLWRRYVLGYPRFVFLLVFQLLGFQKYDLE